MGETKLLLNLFVLRRMWSRNLLSLCNGLIGLVPLRERSTNHEDLQNQSSNLSLCFVANYLAAIISLQLAWESIKEWHDTKWPNATSWTACCDTCHVMTVIIADVFDNISERKLILIDGQRLVKMSNTCTELWVHKCTFSSASTPTQNLHDNVINTSVPK